MDINKDKNWFLFFGVGILWAIVSARKVYAPNINNQLGSTPPTPQPNLANRECPEGQYKDPIGCTTGMDAGSLACAEESKRLGGFRCVEDNRPKSQADCDNPANPFFHYYPKSADQRQIADEMACMPFPQFPQGVTTDNRPQGQNDCSLGTYFIENECLTSDQIIDRRKIGNQINMKDTTPQSQADCSQGLVFNSYYPCGIPGCDTVKQCVTPEEKAILDVIPPPPSAPPRGRNQVTQFPNALTQDRLNRLLNNWQSVQR